MTFVEKVRGAIEKKDSLVCVGLDVDQIQLPHHLFEEQGIDPGLFHAPDLFIRQPVEFSRVFLNFSQAIIRATAPFVITFKPQIAYWAAYGLSGLQTLKMTIDYIHERYTDVLVILDAKRGDIGDTAFMYAKELFDFYGADAVTVNPYLGCDTLEPFFERSDKGVIVLCKTSNKGSNDFQNLIADDPEGLQKTTYGKRSLFSRVALTLVDKFGATGNLGLVMGATYPEQLKEVRDLVGPDIPLLIPGVGKQGGSVPEVVQNNGGGVAIINSSRKVIYASPNEDFAEAAGKEAQRLRDEIREAQKACSS